MFAELPGVYHLTNLNPEFFGSENILSIGKQIFQKGDYNIHRLSKEPSVTSAHAEKKTQGEVHVQTHESSR